MIQANELRLNNVYMAAGTGVLKPVKVTIDNFNQFLKAPEYSANIPLNTEILGKCGFKYTGVDGYRLESGSTLMFYFSLRNGLMCQQFYRRIVESDLVKGCFYIHQLQNLIHALTGEELDVSGLFVDSVIKLQGTEPGDKTLEA